MSDFKVTVQLRTEFPVPVDRLEKLQELVASAQFAHNKYDARDAEALMTQEGDELVISYTFEVSEYPSE